MIDNFNDLPISIQYNHLQDMMYRINLLKLKKININIFSIYYHEALNEFSLEVSFGDNLRGYLLYSKTLGELYEHLDRWEKLDYWSLLIELGENINLSRKQLKL